MCGVQVVVGVLGDEGWTGCRGCGAVWASEGGLHRLGPGAACVGGEVRLDARGSFA